MVNDSLNVSVATLRARQRVYDVHCDVLKWCSSVNRSKGTTVPLVSFMPIACWAVVAPVLEVLCNFQPVKSLPKFFDGLLNSEVTTDSTAVSKLEYPLLR